MENLSYAEAMAAVYEHQFGENEANPSKAVKTESELIEHNLSGIADPYSTEAVRSNVSSRLSQ